MSASFWLGLMFWSCAILLLTLLVKDTVRAVIAYRRASKYFKQDRVREEEGLQKIFSELTARQTKASS